MVEGPTYYYKMKVVRGSARAGEHFCLSAGGVGGRRSGARLKLKFAWFFSCPGNVRGISLLVALRRSDSAQRLALVVDEWVAVCESVRRRLAGIQFLRGGVTL